MSSYVHYDDEGIRRKCENPARCPYGGYKTDEEARAAYEERTGMSAIPKTRGRAAKYDPEKTPRENDEKILEEMGALSKSISAEESFVRELRSALGDRGKLVYTSRKALRKYRLNTFDDIEAEAQEKIASLREEAERTQQGYIHGQADRIAQSLDGLKRQMKETGKVRRRIGKLEDVHSKHQWPRFFLVAGGHVHSSMDCSTCNKGDTPTSFHWQPQLSGKSEADAVAEHGAIMCTVCYPSAPVEWTNHYEQEKERRAAEKCEHSGTRNWAVEPNWNRVHKRAQCQCEAWVSVTSRGAMRAHKPGPN